MTKRQLNEKFKQFACSHYGCDGGNLDSSVWVCGLEWGTEFQDLADLEKTMEGPFNVGNWDGQVQERLKYQYNNKIAWLYSYLYDWEHGHKEQAVKHKLMCSDGIGFKMNAFPISFKNRSSVSWNNDMAKLIGLHSFDVYIEWCISHRGRFFQSLVKKHSPRVIVCTGKGSMMSFFRFFDCDLTTVDDGEMFNVARCNDNNTLVFVVPFFGGASGINSFDKMAALASNISKYADNTLGSTDWK
ncbi:conserved hypothetical protein [Alteromonas macleodii]